MCEILTKGVLESFLRKREMAVILRAKTRIQKITQYRDDYIILLKMYVEEKLERNTSKY